MSSHIRQQIALTERAIAGAFVNNGLYVHLCGNIQGPHTLTFGLRLYEPTQRNINKALGLAGAVEAAISESPIRVYMDRGVILVETPSPVPVMVDGRTLKGQGLAVPLGLTSRQTVAGVDLAVNPHLLLVGPTHRGKTTAARLLAYHLAKQDHPRHVRFIVSTFKPKDWQAFSALAHTFAVITDPQESVQMIDYLVEIMHQRTKAEQDSPQLFIFLDDLLNLLGVMEVDNQLAQLASLGRGAGIHLIIGTQRLGEKGAAGSLVTGNIPTRLVFGTADAQDAALFTGRGGSGAEKLGRHLGDALLITDGGTQRLAVGYIADAHLANLRQDQDGWRPWISRRVTAESRQDAFPRASVTPSISDRHTVTLRTAKGEGANRNGTTTPLDSITRDKMKLRDQEPDADARAYLRRLYEQVGSKREVMRHAWGGVVNQDGNTPKTKRWLDKALTEVIT